LSLEQVYEALAGVCRDLGQRSEAENYARLSREASLGV